MAAIHDAVTALDEWPAAGVALCTSGQILRASRWPPVRSASTGSEWRRPPLSRTSERSVQRLCLMAEDAKVTDRLLEMLDAISAPRPTGEALDGAVTAAVLRLS